MACARLRHASSSGIVLRSRSVSKAPGSRLFTVTLRDASRDCRASPATKPVRPERAPLLKPSVAIGDFTEPEVMFTTRPKPRSAIASTVALISALGARLLAAHTSAHLPAMPRSIDETPCKTHRPFALRYRRATTTVRGLRYAARRTLP